MYLSITAYTLHNMKQVFDLCIRKRVRMQVVVQTCVFCVCVRVFFFFLFRLLQ